MSNFLVIPPELRNVQRAYQRRDYHAVTNFDIIRASLFLDGIFRNQPDGPIRSQVASILIALYYELHRRIRTMPLDTSLPFTGSGGHQAEIVDDIVPFMSLDLWITALEHTHPVRHAPQPRQHQQTINMDGETLRPRRRNDVPPPQFRNRGQLDGVLPVPENHGSVGDIAGMLDTGNGVLGLIAFGLESFALDVLGSLAGGVISVFGLAATWIDSDRQIARLHGAHQTIMTLYDMSFPFRDANLFRRPYPNWPAIRTPIEATLPTGNSHEAQIERTARTEARSRAEQHVRNLETHPIYRVVQYNGREFRVPVTGRAYLYYLNVEARRRGVGVNVYLRDVMQQRTGLNLGVFRWN